MNNQTIHNKKFQNLLTLRDDIARKKNLPKNWIFKDELISNIIKTKEYNNIKNNKNLTDLEKKVLIKNFQQIKIIKEKKNIINENIIRLINVIRSEISVKRSISEQLISNKNDIKMYLENNIKKKSLWREKIFYKITDKLINNKISISISKNNLIFN
jgi:ribonuclease D